MLRPCVAVGGRLRRGAPYEHDQTSADTVAFVIGEEQPGRFAHLYLSPEWFIKGEWIEGEDTQRQLSIMTGNALLVTIVPMDYEDEAEEHVPKSD